MRSWEGTMAFTRHEALHLLEKALAEGHLGHAYLISGTPGSGVRELGNELAALFLGSGEISVEKNPDFHSIEPESKSRRLLTEQVRELEHAIHRMPEKGERKVALVRDADRLMPQAANAFLKTLEEPPDGSLLILTSELPEALLETIRSRCISVVLHTSAPLPRGSREERLARRLQDFFGPDPKADATAAFGITRVFRDLLEEVREEAADRIKEELAAEKAVFGKSTDTDWEAREESLKASSEAEVLRERSLLLGVVADHFGARLRQLNSGELEADVVESRRLIRCLDALEKLRRTLERGIQEGLALEAGFLELMMASKAE
jgi:DNA polymerase III subunit delta'